jgi:cytidyltransferase-like protein
MIITYLQADKIREENPNKRIVFCSGSFDLPHVGHLQFLQECKVFGDILVVMVGSDEIISKLKPGRPIMNEQIRLDMIDGMKPVDYCMKDISADYSDVMAAIDDAIRWVKPDVYCVNDDAFSLDERVALIQNTMVPMVIMPRCSKYRFDNGISTSKVIKRCYEHYRKHCQK